MAFQWTNDQEVGVEKIGAFLKSNKRVFILTGKAGTGKTTIISEALKPILKTDEYDIELDFKRSKNQVNSLFTKTQNVLGICLAHKAKNRLRHSIPNVATFASAYGHKEVYLPDGSRDFVPDPIKLSKAECKKPFLVFVFDEMSQISQKMLDIIFRESNKQAKFIFMGDRGQLPPVESNGNKDSPIFDLDIHPSQKHHLDQRVRQTEGNPLLDLSDIIYEEIFANQDMQRVFKAMKNDSVDSGIGFRSLHTNDFLEDFKSSSEDYLDTKMIAYRRNTVTYYNDFIRKYLYGEQSSKELIKDEIIYMNDSFFLDDSDNSFICHNSSEYKIRSFEEMNVAGYNSYVAHLDPQDSIESKDKFIHIIKDIEKPRLEKYLKSYADKYKWKDFWTLKKKFADFQRGYSLTAYKAQGSTYKNVYLDVNDVLTIAPISNKRKLQTIYTAMTRPTHLVTFLKTH